MIYAPLLYAQLTRSVGVLTRLLLTPLSLPDSDGSGVGIVYHRRAEDWCSRLWESRNALDEAHQLSTCVEVGGVDVTLECQQLQYLAQRYQHPK